MYVGSERDREQRRRRQAAYRASGKHHEAVKRYRQTAKGKASIKRSNDKQISIGDRYIGYCADVARAHAINAHTKERIREFEQRQPTGADLESREACPVRPPAADRAHQLGGRHAHPRD